MSPRHVTIPKFCDLTGYTDDAVRAKMARGVWLEEVVWRRAPDGRVLIDLEAFDRWAEGNQASDPLRTPPSKSTSTTSALAARSG